MPKTAWKSWSERWHWGRREETELRLGGSPHSPVPQQPQPHLTSFLLGSTPRGRSSAAVLTSTSRGKISSFSGSRGVVAVKTSCVDVSTWVGGKGAHQGGPRTEAPAWLSVLSHKDVSLQLCATWQGNGGAFCNPSHPSPCATY